MMQSLYGTARAATNSLSLLVSGRRSGGAGADEPSASVRAAGPSFGQLNSDLVDRVYSFGTPADVVRGGAVSQSVRRALAQPGRSQTKRALASACSEFREALGGVGAADDRSSLEIAADIDFLERNLRLAEHSIRLRVSDEVPRSVKTREELLAAYPVAGEVPNIETALTTGSFRAYIHNVGAFSADGRVFVGVDNVSNYDDIQELSFPRFYLRQGDGRYILVAAPGVTPPRGRNAYASRVVIFGDRGCAVTQVTCPVRYAVLWGHAAPSESLDTQTTFYQFERPGTPA